MMRWRAERPSSSAWIARIVKSSTSPPLRSGAAPQLRSVAKLPARPSMAHQTETSCSVRTCIHRPHRRKVEPVLTLWLSSTTARVADPEPMLLDLTIEPSGSEDFDRARRLLADAREDEALDWFEVASGSAMQADVRASAAAHVAALLLSRGRPWEVAVWADTARQNTPHHGL